jgi:hypothetical protein
MLMCPIDDSQSLLISISFQFSLGKNVNICSKSMLIYRVMLTCVLKIYDKVSKSRNLHLII